MANLSQDVVERARDLLPAGVRDNAEAAVLAAAFHDRDERARAFDARRRQVVEFLDLGKRDVHLRLAGCAPSRDELGQPMQGLRAEDQIHIGRAAHDFSAFLAGDAAADADQEPRLRGLQAANAPQVGKHLLLRLLAHGTGVEEDEVRLGGIRGLLEALGGGEHVGHLVRVVLVHLASERADEDLLVRHGVLVRGVDSGQVSYRAAGQILQQSATDIGRRARRMWAFAHKLVR